MYDRAMQLSIGPEDLIIVEGVPALIHDDLVASADLRVHVDMPEAKRIANLRADYRWRGEADESVDAVIASRAIDESESVLDARGRADFTVTAWTSA